MRIKYLILIIIAFVILSTELQMANKTGIKSNGNYWTKMIVPIMNSQEQQDSIVAFKDSVTLFEGPSDTYKIIGYLKLLEQAERITGSLDNKPGWIPLKINNDTSWINSNNISLEMDIDSFKNIAIYNRIYYREISGIGYSGSIVKNTMLNKVIYEGELDLSKSFYLNDSIFLLCGSMEMCVHNSLTGKSLLIPYSSAAVISKDQDAVFFLRYKRNETELKSSGRKHLYELVKYDYEINTSNILYTTEHDSLSPYYTAGEDGMGHTDLQIKWSQDTLLLDFNMYVEKENPEYEFDPDTYIYHFSVDTFKNCSIKKIQ